MKNKKFIGGVVILVIAVTVTGLSFMFGKNIEPVPMTLEELRQYDGQDGRPMYVAVDGNVYDLTKCRYWEKGVHTESPVNAIAGRDLTEVLKESKHGIKRVKRYPRVGYIVDSKDE